MVNKKKIRITYIRDYGRCHELFCSRCLMLRCARHAGDEEVINHYQLGKLNLMRGSDFDFEIIG